MEARPPVYATTKLSTTPPFVETHLPPGQIPPNSGPRPLSDIRELSEPSIMDAIVQRPGNTHQNQPSTSRTNSLRQKSSLKRSGSSRAGQNVRPQRSAHDGLEAHARPQAHTRSQSADPTSSSYSSTPERSSFYSIPHASVPRRSSSQTHIQRPAVAGAKKQHARKPSLRRTPPPPPSQSAGPSRFEGFTVPNYGPSRSPVKDARLKHDGVRSDGIGGRRTSSRTYIRTPHPTDILEFPAYRHPRVKLELQVSAPLFVGGGSIEGQVKVTVDENERLKSRRSLGLGAISVDLVGFEDVDVGRKASFLAVGTEVIDATHPPPVNMVEPPNPLRSDDKFWTLAPSNSALPFMVSLPLDTGPPPFQSKHANIRFLLCATALIRDAGKHYRVRTSQPISVLATYDPEKALTSLPSPLTATDELTIRHFGRCESVILTAGLHRQVWVSGSSIFVDVHLANKSHKPVRKLELSLERDILCYKHAPAATREKSASQARIFENNEQAMITRTSLKAGLQGWNGVEAHESETRTCELPLPRGHATVRCGKFFEVRFFLNVTASLTNSKLVSVQLPITVIHINSLDVLPNSVAQVAAAIEEKRAQTQHQRSKSRPYVRGHHRQRSASSPAAMEDLRRRPSYSQGRAFAAPRQQEADRQKAEKADMEVLAQALDESPRKLILQSNHATGLKKMVSITNISSSNLSSGLGGKKVKEKNPFADLAFKTPIPKKREQKAEHAILDAGKLTRIQSLESLHSKASKSSRHPLPQPSATKAAVSAGPPYHFTVLKQHHIHPHALGLSSSGSDIPQEKQRMEARGGAGTPADPVTRPATGLSFRERMERSRFEFKGVGRKGSGRSVRERGVGLWESVRHRGKEKEREGWI